MTAHEPDRRLRGLARGRLSASMRLSARIEGGGLKVPVVRCGIDLVSVERIAESLARHGERFVRRLYTAAEQSDAQAAPALRTQRLASRFAAKEAAIKALGLVDAGLNWADIEVVRQPDGHCTLALHGPAARRAQDWGLDSLALSLSHEPEWAIAVVHASFHGLSRPLNSLPIQDPRRTQMNTATLNLDPAIDQRIRGVLRDHARLGRPAESLAADDDLYLAGMSSHASVNVMLALEGLFDIEFPDAMLNRQVFSSVQSIRTAVARLAHLAGH